MLYTDTQILGYSIISYGFKQIKFAFRVYIVKLNFPQNTIYHESKVVFFKKPHYLIK